MQRPHINHSSHSGPWNLHKWTPTSSTTIHLGKCITGSLECTFAEMTHFREDCIMRGGREPLRPWAMERVEEKGKKKKKNHYDNRMQRGSAPKEVSSLQLRINSSNLSGSGMCQVTPLESRLGLVWIPPGKGDSGRLLLPPTSHSLSALEWFSSPFFLPARRITSGSLSSKCFVCRPAKLCSQLSSACTRVGSVRAAMQRFWPRFLSKLLLPKCLPCSGIFHASKPIRTNWPIAGQVWYGPTDKLASWEVL